MKQVRKRDGRIVEFDRFKIIEAVAKAFESVDGAADPYAAEKANNIATYIEDHIKDNEIIDIEQIQDLVEHGLMSSKRKDVAKAYITYREERTRIRQCKTKLIQTVKEKLTASNVQNQNANVDEHSFGGRMGEANDAVAKQLALDELLSDMSRNNHLNNEIYIHDLSAYYVGSHNCLSIPFDDLLANGFNTRQTDVRPAGSVNTAFQLVAVIFQLQSLQQFGGVSATHLDWTMVPYVRKSFYKHFLDGVKYCQDGKIMGLMGIYEPIDLSDAKRSWIESKTSIENQVFTRNEKAYAYAMDMTEKEVHQAVEGMYHNLNTLQSRSGNQLK